MATGGYKIESNEEMYTRAEAPAIKFEIDKKDKMNFLEEKVKLRTSEQKEYLKTIADRERDERAAIRAHEKELKEKDLEMARLTATKEKTNSNQNTDTSNNLKRLNIPYFDGKEDIDAFFRTFEMSCKSQEIPRKDWSKYLLQSVKEKARVAMSYIDIEHSDYDEVKRQMLSYFVKTPDYYRNRFHKVQLDSSKEPAAFVKDVQHYLITWLELSNIDLKDPKQIIDMMVYDKVLQMASEDLFSYLKEKQIHSIDKLISALNSYKDSHPGAVLYKSSHSNNFSTYHNRSGGNVQSNVSNFRRYSYSPNFHNSRRHSDSPPKRNEREQKSQRRKVLPCFYCNRTNHIAS